MKFLCEHILGYYLIFLKSVIILLVNYWLGVSYQNLK